MTYIKKLTMSGFKSFGDRTVSIKFSKGFTTIVGPNGNGKSNVVDAICFALGRLSKKTMRAKSLTDLIFAGTNKLKPASKAEVTITFDNKNKEFPTDSEDFNITRWVKNKGTSGYKVEGKGATREQVLNVLAQANVDPDGENQFVLQGRIVELTHMNTNARREFIEGLIGLSKYDEMKADTLKELEKADKDLGEFEAIFREVTTQLKKVEKEKNDALRWKELDNKINLFNAQLIALKINNLRKEEEQINTETEETHQIIEELQGKVNRQKELIEAESLYLKGIEENLANQETDKSKLDETLSLQKADLSAKETELKNAKENLKRLEDRKIKLEELQDKLDKDQTYDDLIKTSNTQVADLVKKIADTTAVVETTVQEQKQREEKINEVNKEKAAINEEISTVRQEISKCNTEMELMQKAITKNEKKLEKMNKDLAKLKKEGESVEAALKAAEGELETINKNIEDLKVKIEEQKKKQKQLDKDIDKAEKERDGINKKYSGVQSTISSANTEITLTETRIKELEAKQAKLKADFEKATAGQKTEERIKQLRDQETAVNKELTALKTQLAKANEDQKSGQTKKEAIETKRRAVEGQMADIEKRLSGLKAELKSGQADQKNAEKDKTTADTAKKALETELSALTEQQKKLQKQGDTIQGKITKLTKDRKDIQDKIAEKEGEHDKSSTELKSVLDNLTELMENIEKSSTQIKADIQNASLEAISKSGDGFKQYVMDINDMMKTVEEVSKMKELKEIQENMTPIVENFRSLIENADSTIDQLKDTVKEANDIAVQEASKNFDGFIHDFTAKFDNIHVALQAVALADNSELYKNLDNVNAEMQTQSSKLAEINKELTKINTQVELKEKESKKLEAQITELTKKIEDATARVEKGQKENDEKAAQATQMKEEIATLSTELEDSKKSSEDFWKVTKEMQTKIDAKTEEAAKIQKMLTDLANIKRMLEDIDAAEKEKAKLKGDIETKKKAIVDLNTSAEKVQADLVAADENINKIKAERAKCDEVRNETQKQIDEQNEKIKEATDKLRGLQTVQKLINDIEALKVENNESNEKIAQNTKKIEGFNKDIAKFDEQIAGKDKIIETIKTERKNLEEKETELRKDIQGLSDNKSKVEKTLAKQHQMKERATEIEGIIKEIADMNKSIAEFDKLIKETTASMAKNEADQAEKIKQITDLKGQKDASWEKQKKLRDELSDLTAEYSKNDAKRNALESRKLVVEEKINQLMEQSKDFGTLPPVTDDLSEPGLADAIAKSTVEKKSLEPVNLKSIEEYDVVKERWDEIDMRRQTLQRERKAIMDSIERIELEKTRTFMKAYHDINRVFAEVFQKLSPGGSAKMLLENPAHPFEGGVAIEARPRGKKISSLSILSGGEKTLVALSFIFAVQNFYPAPFYIMDEIDAALDGPNVYRVSQVIKEYSTQSQFIVISHREENITNSDRIYGVAMQDGITDIFTVNLEEEKKREDFNAPDEKVEKDELIISDTRDQARDETDEVVDEENSAEIDTSKKDEQEEPSSGEEK